MLDYTRGTVIGPICCRVTLHAPKGFEVARTSVELDGDSHKNALAWARRERDRKLDEQCGDGKPLRDHPKLVRDIYGLGEWELREWSI